MSVAIQADGKIVVAGDARIDGDYDIAVARYRPDGTPDTSFGGDGKVAAGLGANEYGNDVAHRQLDRHREPDAHADRQLVGDGHRDHDADRNQQSDNDRHGFEDAHGDSRSDRNGHCRADQHAESECDADARMDTDDLLR